MSQKLADGLAYPPRAMRAERAAAYLDISPATFHRLVTEGILPAGTIIPGHNAVSWDRLDLDAAYEDWKTTEREGNTMHKLLDRNQQGTK
jgi:hypothetical protein